MFFYCCCATINMVNKDLQNKKNTLNCNTLTKHQCFDEMPKQLSSLIQGQKRYFTSCKRLIIYLLPDLSFSADRL